MECSCVVYEIKLLIFNELYFWHVVGYIPVKHTNKLKTNYNEKHHQVTRSRNCCPDIFL